MAIFSFQIFKSFGGRSNRFDWSNVHYVDAALALDSPDVAAIAARFVAAERLGHFEDVHFMSCRINQVARNVINRPGRDHVSIELDGNGSRVRSWPLTPIEVCLEVKRMTTHLRSGTLLYRGCLSTDDVNTSADNSFVLSNPATFAGTAQAPAGMLAALNSIANDYNVCIPNKPGLLDVVTTGRRVLTHKIGGVALSQATRRRKTADAAYTDGAVRELRKLEKAAIDIISGGLAGVGQGVITGQLEVLGGQAALVLAAIPLSKRGKVISGELKNILSYLPRSLPTG